MTRKKVMLIGLSMFLGGGLVRVFLVQLKTVGVIGGIIHELMRLVSIVGFFTMIVGFVKKDKVNREKVDNEAVEAGEN